MKHALLCCIHGNRPAFEAVLADIDEVGVDRRWCLGDVVGYGPDPGWCIDALRERGWVCLRGNHEEALFDSAMSERFNRLSRDALFYSMGALTRAQKDWLRTLPDEVVEERFHLVHGSPAGLKTQQYVLGEEDVRAALAAAARPLVFIGHTHRAGIAHAQPDGGIAFGVEPEHRLAEDRPTIVNVGSVGQPRDKDPRACWVCHDDETGTVVFRRVAYDREEAKRLSDQSGLPAKFGERLLVGV